MGRPLLEIKGLVRRFSTGDQQIEVLKGLDLTIHAGEMVAIVGASGSGKSTLMNILGCLDRPSEGSYRIDGRETGSLSDNELAGLRRDYFGFIFQRYNLLATSSASENIEIPAVYAGLTKETLGRGQWRLLNEREIIRLRFFNKQSFLKKQCIE